MRNDKRIVMLFDMTERSSAVAVIADRTEYDEHLATDCWLE